MAAAAAAICLCVCRRVVKINTRLPSRVVVASVPSVCACTAAVVCFLSHSLLLLLCFTRHIRSQSIRAAADLRRAHTSPRARFIRGRRDIKHQGQRRRRGNTNITPALPGRAHAQELNVTGGNLTCDGIRDWWSGDGCEYDFASAPRGGI